MLKILLRSVGVFVLCFVILGLIYPYLIFFVGQALFKNKANGSLLFNERGNIVGSSLIGQKFTNSGFLWSRPSAGDYNSLKAGASNIAADSLKYKALKNSALAGDMLFESASGLDPHITYQSALQQMERILKHRRIDHLQLLLIIEKNRQSDISGKDYVNVLGTNLMLTKFDMQLYE